MPLQFALALWSTAAGVLYTGAVITTRRIAGFDLTLRPCPRVGTDTDRGRRIGSVAIAMRNTRLAACGCLVGVFGVDESTRRRDVDLTVGAGEEAPRRSVTVQFGRFALTVKRREVGSVSFTCTSARGCVAVAHSTWRDLTVIASVSVCALALEVKKRIC